MRRAVIALWASLCALATGSAARAQTVHGIVVDRNDRPVEGAVVLLVDSTSAIAARALSDGAGAYSLTAAHPGTYALRTLRIGFRPEQTPPLALAPVGAAERRIVLAGIQISLDTVRVVGRSMCGAQSDSALAVFSVWEQARAALNAAQLASGAGVVQAMTVLYERTLAPDARHILTETSSLHSGFVARPWASATPEALHRSGYVVANRDNTVTYFAPGLDVLLSPGFVADHCFKLAGGRAAPAGSIGVAFEPARERRNVPEIRGTLWLDRKTAQLTELQFKFTNIPPEQEDNAGGDMTFAPLGNGAWAVTRWNIRMPVIEEVVRSRDLGGNLRRVAEIHVAGGELALVTRLVAGRAGRDTVWSQPLMHIAGTAADSVTGDPIGGARITVIGTAVAATSDERGHFVLEGLLPGEYDLDVSTPSLAAIGVASRHPVKLADSMSTLQLRVPTAAQFAGILCGTAGFGPSAGVVLGHVRRSGDTAAVGAATVIAEWTEIVLRDDPSLSTVRRRAEARTTVDGTFRLCGVPLNTDIALRADAGGASSRDVPVRLTDGRIARAELALDRPLDPGARLVGVVLDSAGSPIAGAEVAIPDLSKHELTDPRGRFEVAGIAGGEHHVLVRRVGYAVVDAALSFRDGAAVERTIVLSRVAALDSVVVQAEHVDVLMRDFEDNRTIGLGQFVTHAQLEKLKGQPLTRALEDVPGIRFARGGALHAWVLSKRVRPSLCRPVNPGVHSECYDANGIYNPTASEAARGVGAGCYVAVFIDGVLLNRGRPTPPFDAGSFSVDEIEAVEYYAGVSELPARYSVLNADCGVMVIHTRRP